MVSIQVYVMHIGLDLWWIMMQDYQISRFTKLLHYMGPNGPYFELIYYDDMIYKGWIGSKFILMHKRVLVIT